MNSFEDMSFNSDFSFGQSPQHADGCTQCGICLNTCPTFAQTRDFNASPMGRIKLLRQLDSVESTEELTSIHSYLSSCLVCRGCESVCPSRVDYVRHLDEGLARIPARIRLRNRVLKFMLTWTGSEYARRIVRFPLALLRAIPASLAEGLSKTLPQGFHRLVQLLDRDNPVPHDHCVETVDDGHANQRVALFTGCATSFLQNNLVTASVNVLKTLNIEVTAPATQTCCGSLHRHNGELATSNKLARQNLDSFCCSDSAVLTLASGCEAGLKDYPMWLDNDTVYENAAHQFVSRTVDVCDYLAALPWPDGLTLGPLAKKVCIHIPCSVRDKDEHLTNLHRLLDRIPKLTVLDATIRDRCCGAGGSHSFTHPDSATSILNPTLEQIMHTGADIVLTTNSGCAAHIRAGLKTTNAPIEILHPVELLERSLCTR